MKVRDVRTRLEALDWTIDFDWTDEGVKRRVAAAAKAVGAEAARSHVSDDGHWGGYQLRSVELLRVHGVLCFDAIVAGYGYELEPCEALRECRSMIANSDFYADDDEVSVIDALLPMLAMPFGEWQSPEA